MCGIGYNCDRAIQLIEDISRHNKAAFSPYGNDCDSVFTFTVGHDTDHVVRLVRSESDVTEWYGHQQGSDDNRHGVFDRPLAGFAEVPFAEINTAAVEAIAGFAACLVG